MQIHLLLSRGIVSKQNWAYEHYRVILKPRCEEDIKRHLKAGNKKLVLKVSRFLDELKEHPCTGLGKPEQLKGEGENIWSRRIDARYRLVL